MKKQLLFLFLIIGFMGYSQGVVTGTVIASDTNEPLSGASVVQTGTSNGTITDMDGNFTLNVSSNTGTIEISYLGFLKSSKLYRLTAGAANIGSLVLATDADALDEVVIVGRGIIDLAADRSTPIAVSSISSAEIQAKAVGNVEFPEVMKNTPSIYVSNQAGGFGDSQMFLRGFDQVNTAFLLNGQPINGMEDGRMYWSNWSGMSDVANAVQVQRGLGSSKLAISSVGGTVNIVSKAAERRQGGFVRLMAGNDSYMKGTMSYDTGLNGKWAFSFMLDHWQGHRKWAEGTAGQGQNYFIGIGFVPNEKHSLNFLLTGAPQWHDQNFSKGMADYDQYGKKYNGNTGFLDGTRQSERTNYYHKPVANLNWDFDINETLELSTVLYASWGRGGGTGPFGRGAVVRNPDTGWIVWDDIVDNNLDAAENGVASSNDARILRSSVNNHNWYGLLSNLYIETNNNFNFNIGVDGRTYTGTHFRQVNNLLGLSGIDVNGVVLSDEYDAKPWSALFNSADENERLDYDYSETINYIGGFGQAEYATDNFSAFVQGAASTQSYQREGRFASHTDGLGKSDKLSKFGYNIKGGMGYSFTERSTVFVNAGHYSRQPFLDNIFVDIRSSNELLDGDNKIDNEEITGFEAGYRYDRGDLKIDVNVYHTTWGNRFVAGGLIEGDGTSHPITGKDRYQRFTDVTQVHIGGEFEVKYRYSNILMLRAFGSIGNWKYDGTTPFQTREDDTNQLLEEGNLDLTGTKIGNAPQTSFGFGFKYEICKGLSLDADYNIFTDLYGFVEAGNVIEASLAGETYQAERLPAYTLLDAGITYKFDFGGNRFTIRGNVYNLANDMYINQKESFGYFWGSGRTFNASIRYDF